MNKLNFCINMSWTPTTPVSPVWPVTVCGLHRASVGASVRGNVMGLQPAPPLCHQKRAVWQQHWKTAWPMSSGHHSLRQSPVTRQKYGEYWYWAAGVCAVFHSVSGLCFYSGCQKSICLSVLSHLCRCCGGRSCSLSSVTGPELQQTTASSWLLSKVNGYC